MTPPWQSETKKQEDAQSEATVTEPKGQQEEVPKWRDEHQISKHDTSTDAGRLAAVVACYHPLTLYRGLDGRLVGTKPAGRIPRPVTISCRQCIGCLLEHSRQWAVRCVHESKMHESNCFITLTYDPEHLPLDWSLDLTHWQEFAKRLRQHYSRHMKALGIAPPFKPFRFFHCGEYGKPEEGDFENSHGRPHYHALLFGKNFLPDRKFHKHTENGDKLYTSEVLTRTWGKGQCLIGELTHESAAYVARYTMKRKRGDQAKDFYQHVDLKTGEVTKLKPEYATMSRRPGIGAAWFAKFGKDVYPHDYVVNQDGKTGKPPRFYDTLLERTEPETLEAIKLTRVQKALPHKRNNTPKRLKVRETVKIAQISTLNKSTL